MPQMQIYRGGQMNPNPLNESLRTIGAQMERKALIEGERAYAAGQLREARAVEEAQYQQQLQDQRKEYAMKTWFEQNVKLLFSGQIPPDKRSEGLNMLVDGYVSTMGPITGETRSDTMNITVPKIVGEAPIGPPKSDAIVPNAENREKNSVRGIKTQAANSALSGSQIEGQIGDLLRRYPSTQTSEPGKAEQALLIRLWDQVEAAKENLEAEKAKGDEADPMRIIYLSREHSKLERQFNNYAKKIGVADFSSLEDDNTEANSADTENATPDYDYIGIASPDIVAIQFKELIEAETDPESKAELQTILHSNNTEKMRKALELSRGQVR